MADIIGILLDLFGDICIGRSMAKYVFLLFSLFQGYHSGRHYVYHSVALLIVVLTKELHSLLIAVDCTSRAAVDLAY